MVLAQTSLPRFGADKLVLFQRLKTCLSLTRRLEILGRIRAENVETLKTVLVFFSSISPMTCYEYYFNSIDPIKNYAEFPCFFN